MLFQKTLVEPGVFNCLAYDSMSVAVPVRIFRKFKPFLGLEIVFFKNLVKIYGFNSVVLAPGKEIASHLVKKGSRV